VSTQTTANHLDSNTSREVIHEVSAVSTQTTANHLDSNTSREVIHEVSAVFTQTAANYLDSSKYACGQFVCIENFKNSRKSYGGLCPYEKSLLESRWISMAVDGVVELLD